MLSTEDVLQKSYSEEFSEQLALLVDSGKDDC